MDEIEFNVINEMRPLVVTKEDKHRKIRGVFFESILKDNANDPTPWSYTEGGKTISFGPKDIRWSDGTIVKNHPEHSTGTINKTDMRYCAAFGHGFDVEITQNNYVWRKTIEIQSLESLGAIPEGATHLDIRFDLGGNAELPDGVITKSIKFGTKSLLHPIRIWESSGESVYIEGEISGTILTKRIPVEFLKEASYPIKTDTTITYGTEACFNSAATHHPSVSALDSTHFVVAYSDYGGSYYGCAKIGTISGTTISYGSEYCFTAATTYSSVVKVLDSTHFVIAYGYLSSARAKIGTISGTTISYGSEYIFNSDNIHYLSVSALDSTHFVVAYQDDGSGYGCARIGTVSGTTISYGAENCFNTSSSVYISVAALDSTHFVVAYRHFWGTTDDVCAKIGTVSGTTISYGSEYCFDHDSATYISISTIDSTHFVLAYRSPFGSGYGCARIGTISGTTISYGSEYIFNYTSTYFIYTSILDSTHFVVAYADAGISGHGYAEIGTISGTAISYGAENCFNTADTDHIVTSALDSTHFVITYVDDGGSDYGCARTGSYTEFATQIIMI